LRKLDHSIVVAATYSQWRRRLSACVSAMVDILNTFYDGFMIQCVNLMLRIFELGVLLFDCFVYRPNVTCPKVLSGMGITQVRWKT